MTIVLGVLLKFEIITMIFISERRLIVFTWSSYSSFNSLVMAQFFSCLL